MKARRSIALAVCSVALLFAGCGADSDADDDASAGSSTTGSEASSTSAEASSTTTAEETTTTVGETTTTTAQAPPATSETGFPETPAAAFLAQTYLFGAEQGIPSADQLPFPANSVSVHWYRSDGFYVVTYGGLAPELAVCPGNSIQTATGFEHVSNAPLAGADCSFAPVVAEAPNGVVTCNRMVSYVTLIPADTEGALFGTVEVMTDGVGVGLTSQVVADPASIPEIGREVIDC